MNFANLMQGMGPNLLDAVGQGVLWGIMVLGVYITFKLLDIADLTVDGSFALGGCVCATLIVHQPVDYGRKQQHSPSQVQVHCDHGFFRHRL